MYHRAYIGFKNSVRCSSAFSPDSLRKISCLFIAIYRVRKIPDSYKNSIMQLAESLNNDRQWNIGPICLLGAKEQLPMCHLFIQSTALFALSNITYYVFYVDKGEEQIDICLMLCFLLRISEQCSVCSELTNRPIMPATTCSFVTITAKFTTCVILPARSLFCRSFLPYFLLAKCL